MRTRTVFVTDKKYRVGRGSNPRHPALHKLASMLWETKFVFMKWKNNLKLSRVFKFSILNRFSDMTVETSHENNNLWFRILSKYIIKSFPFCYVNRKSNHVNKVVHD